MNNVQYKKFLLEIVRQIKGLLIASPTAKANFQDNIQAFYKKSDDYSEALKKRVKKAHKKPKWKEYGDGKPP